MNSYEERRVAKAERYRQYAANALQRASETEQAVRRITEAIPPGQPILIGHHSERRHRRDAERIRNGMVRQIEETKKAEYWRGRAHAVESDTSIRREDPAAAAKLRTKIAGLEAQLARRKEINARLRQGAALDTLDLSAAERIDLESVSPSRLYYGERHAAETGYPPYAIQNISGTLRRLRERLPALELREAQRARARAARPLAPDEQPTP